jgi:hypothetical protein
MRMQLHAGALALALLSGIGLAAAQNSPGDQSQSGQQQKLSPSQEQSVQQGLSREPSQQAAGYQGQVGSTPPASLKQQPLPSDVTAQVPQTREMLFIKLPDRILLINPQTRTVAEIVPAAGVTTGGGSPGQR